MKIKNRFFKFGLLFCILCLLSSLFFQPAAQAAGFGKGPGQKFVRGITYLVTAPFRLPKEMIQTAAESEPVYLAPWRAISVGAGNGLYQAGRQGLAGLYDLFTFWSPTDRDWAPLFEPSSFFPEV